MDGFELRREKKKKSILDSAIILFSQYGYNKVSIAEIAKKANVSQVSIYNFFGSKDNLRKKIIYNLLKEDYSKTEKILSSKESVEDILEKIIKLRIEFTENCDVKFFLDSINSDIDLKKEYIKVSESLKTKIIRFIKKGKKEDFFDSNLSDESIILYLDFIQSSIINNEIIRKSYIWQKETVEDIFKIFIKGIKKNKFHQM